MYLIRRYIQRRMIQRHNFYIYPGNPRTPIRITILCLCNYLSVTVTCSGSNRCADGGDTCG